MEHTLSGSAGVLAPPNDISRSAVSWPAIIAGGFVAAAVSLILFALGSIGFFAGSSFQDALIVQVAAGLPATPSGLSSSKLLAIGIIAGLLAGCGIALARDQLDTRLRTRPDLGGITDAPVLAELPQDSDVRSGEVTIAMVQAPQSQMAESIRELRTSLRVILDDMPCPMITVTSPEAGDGKTFVAANLAAAWAMSGSKVIVVSADFRRPRLEEIFGLEVTGQPGLSNLIRANWKNSDPNLGAGGAKAEGVPPTRPGERRAPGADRPTPPRSRRDFPAVADQPYERVTIKRRLSS